MRRLASAFGPICAVSSIIAMGSGCSMDTLDIECLPKKQAVYSVGRGEHYFQPQGCLAKVTESRLKFRARFSPSTLYDLSELKIPEQQVNKLYGFTDCGSMKPEENSARFGWIVQDGKLILQTFVHAQNDPSGKTMFFDLKKPLATIEPDTWYRYEMWIDGKGYVFKVLDDHDVEIAQERVERRGCEGSGGTKYRLNPYFGGKSPAPHPMTIEVEIL